MINYRVVLLILLLMALLGLRDNMADWWIADKVKETVETVKESAKIAQDWWSLDALKEDKVQPQVAVEQPIDNTQVLDADTMATLYNTEQGKNRDIWIKNYNTLEPKTDQQVKNLEEFNTNFDMQALKVYKTELTNLNKDGYTTEEIKAAAGKTFGSESSYGIKEQSLDNPSKVHGDMQVKYSSFIDAAKQGYLGKKYGELVKKTPEQLKNMSYEEFKTLMRDNKSAAQLAGIGILLQKLRNKENKK